MTATANRPPGSPRSLQRPSAAVRATRAPRPRAPLPHAALSLPLALLVALAAGIGYAFAFPSTNLWILAFPAVGLFLASLRGRGFWSGMLVGLAFGAAFWFSLISWVTLFLGSLPLLALGTLESLFVAAGGGLIAVAFRSIGLLWPDRWGRFGVAPLVIAAIWTMQETVAGTWPYGGFAWGRFAVSQSTSPFASLSAWFGVTGLSFVLAWLTAFGVALVTEPVDPFRRVGRIPRPVLEAASLARVLVATVVAGGVLLIPAFPITVTGAMRIAAVQPDTHAGYFDPLFDPKANLDTTVLATVPAVGRSVDLVVWPEGATMYDPLTDQPARQVLATVSSEVGAPLLAGAITERGSKTYNSSLLWVPDVGFTSLYDKVRPVPFGEYVPDRAFWTPFAPDLLKLIGRDYTPGTRSSLMEVGRATIGVNICFDIIDDGLILGSVADGAEVLVAQTNNADFGDTAENEQQLAIARLRAIETGRAIVSDSTVASTTAIGPDGVTLAAAKPFQEQTLITDVPLASGITPAVAFGITLGAAIALLGGILPLMLAGLARPLRRRGPG